VHTLCFWSCGCAIYIYIYIYIDINISGLGEGVKGVNPSASDVRRNKYQPNPNEGLALIRVRCYRIQGVTPSASDVRRDFDIARAQCIYTERVRESEREWQREKREEREEREREERERKREKNTISTKFLIPNSLLLAYGAKLFTPYVRHKIRYHHKTRFRTHSILQQLIVVWSGWKILQQPWVELL
jgi:hypothetical protein